MKIPDSVKNFAKIFKSNNFQIYLVGGAVRDYLLGKKENSDYDFTTDAKPNEVIKMFPAVVPVGIEHGTVLVLFEGHQFEVTTFRTEGKYSDGRRPDEVNFVRNLDEDLKRRDFTINAFAYDLIKNKFIDKFKGKKDLKKKIIRAIGNPEERFSEDALRMIRACRFASKLNFMIEENTLNAIEKLTSLIQNISKERIKEELIKIMETDKPSTALEYMRITGLLKIILPELLGGYGVIQNRFHKFDVYYHNIFSCDAAPKNNYIIRLAALFHDISKPQTKREKEEENEGENSFYNHEIIGAKTAYHILKRLKFSNEEIKKITHLIKYHMFYYTDEWTDGAVRRFIRNVGTENLSDLFTLRDSDRSGNGTKSGIPKTFLDFKDRIKRTLEIDSALKVTDLNINGNTLQNELELNPGPMIGEVLDYLLELCLDNPDFNKEDILLLKAKEYYEKKTKYALDMYGSTPDKLGRF